MLKDLYIGESGDGFVEKPVGGRSYLMEIEMAVLQSAWMHNGPPQLAPKEAPL